MVAVGSNSTPTVFDTEFSAAVTVTAVAVVTAAAVAVNVPVDAPEATVTEAGTVRSALFDDNVTAVELVVVALSATEQLSVPAPVIVLAVQATPVSVGVIATAGLSVTVVVAVLPTRDAVIVAVVVVVTALAVAVNDADDAPVATVALAGTLRLPVELDSATAVAAVAGPLRSI